MWMPAKPLISGNGSPELKAGSNDWTTSFITASKICQNLFALSKQIVASCNIPYRHFQHLKKEDLSFAQNHVNSSQKSP